jgi:hypothetical protein
VQPPAIIGLKKRAQPVCRQETNYQLIFLQQRGMFSRSILRLPLIMGLFNNTIFAFGYFDFTRLVILCSTAHEVRAIEWQTWCFTITVAKIICSQRNTYYGWRIPREIQAIGLFSWKSCFRTLGIAGPLLFQFLYIPIPLTLQE